MGRGRKSRPRGAQGNAAFVPPESSPDKMSQQNLTPYQGKQRAFGFFWCEECDEEWTPSNSWANTYQMCLTCDTAVYPYRQVSEPEQLTPYQGKQRAFGHYRCPGCEVEWTSANSWANTYQKCKTCNTAIYPYRQYKVKRGKGSRKRKSHPRRLCQRCIETGLPCWEEEEQDYPWSGYWTVKIKEERKMGDGRERRQVRVVEDDGRERREVRVVEDDGRERRQVRVVEDDGRQRRQVRVVEDDWRERRQVREVEDDGRERRQVRVVEDDGRERRQVRVVEDDGRERRQVRVVEDDGRERRQVRVVEESYDGGLVIKLL